MAASSAPRTAGPCKMLAFALLLAASLLNAGVMAQEDDVNGSTAPPLNPETTEPMSAGTSDAPASGDPQVLVYPDVEEADQIGQTTVAAAATATGEAADEAGDDGDKLLVEIRTERVVFTPGTEAPMPPRGDGPVNEPQSVPSGDVVCVSKEAVQDKNAVSLKLKASSNCEDTRVKIQSVLLELCGEDCKLDIYQEDDSDQILVSGKYVEGDVVGMTNKFNNDNIKDKTDVEEASSHWGKSSKLVLVSLLLAGLLLAALLVAGYYLKTHYKASKGVRLAESFQVDEENQANTLVSVAPLPQEPLDKPTVNGESPPENGTNPAPATNGHSATQTPVADTEM